MTATLPATLKTYFDTGDKPTQSQFTDVMDSFVSILTGQGEKFVPTGTSAPSNGIYAVTASAIGIRAIESVNIYSHGALHSQFTTGASAAVNTLAFFNATSGNNAGFSVQGEATAGCTIYTAGTGNFSFYTHNVGSLACRFMGVTNAVNWVDITPGTTGQGAELVANGETDVNLKLTPKGSAFVQYGTVVADAGINNTGYIRIRDAGGTIRRVAICSGS